MDLTTPITVTTPKPPQVGDVVLYRLEKGNGAGKARPAIVVLVRSADVVGLHVLTAGILDSGSECERGAFSGFLDHIPRGGPGVAGTWWPR